MASQSELLKQFYRVTGWQYENSYGSLTLPSRSLLDFSINPGLHLNLTHRPTSNFASSLSLSTLVPTHAFDYYPPSTTPVLAPPVSPTLAGQLAYVFSSAPLDRATTKRAAALEVEPSGSVRLKQIVNAFHPGLLPVRPELREDAQPTWLAGERVDRKDFLLFGQLYAPAPRLDALWVHRLSPTFQTLVSLISVPSPLPSTPLTWQPNNDDAPAPSPTPSGTLARQSELEFKLMQDLGRWSTEYSYAVGDDMWGARFLYNFGKSGGGLSAVPWTVEVAGASDVGGVTSSGVSGEAGEPRERVVDEEEEMSTGLKGRWSAGGEVYFSAQERSAGFSTGVRFSTLPEPPGSKAPSQPPTTLTATVSPIMGQLSTAYCVATSPDSALASRFDFNFFSYDADLTIGGEWFQRRQTTTSTDETLKTTTTTKPYSKNWDPFGRSTAPSTQLASVSSIDELETLPLPPMPPALSSIPTTDFPRDTTDDGEITGVIKARFSTNTDLALMWQGRLADFLLSIGVVADLRLATGTGGRRNPIRSVGIGVQYWG